MDRLVSKKKLAMYATKISNLKKTIVKQTSKYIGSGVVSSIAGYGADYLLDDVLGLL